jgi:catechol 2,3-dioxygenase-like lactoylglutathione lyase family enzyme
MALADGRIFHVNVNCSDLARSRRFYVDGLGLTEGVRTAAGHTQSGAAFGLDRARWDVPSKAAPSTCSNGRNLGLGALHPRASRPAASSGSAWS